MRQHPGPTTFQWPRQCRQCGVAIKAADGDLCGPCADLLDKESGAGARPVAGQNLRQQAEQYLRQQVARELVIVRDDINYYTGIDLELHRTLDQCMKQAAALQAYLEATPEDDPA